MKVKVYTDGACRNNGKASANSSIGIYFSNRNLHKIDNISEVLKLSKHTNNIAELTAINKSLSLIKLLLTKVRNVSAPNNIQAIDVAITHFAFLMI